MTQNMARKNSRRLLYLPIAAAAIVVAGLVVWSGRRGYEKTDDAQVEGKVHPVSARVAGYVQELLVEENEEVAEGQVVVRLDVTTYETAVRQAEGDLHAAQAAFKAAEEDYNLVGKSTAAQVSQARALVASATAQLDVARAEHEAASVMEDRARDDLERTRPLAGKGLAPVHRLNTLQSAWEAARSSRDSAQARVAASQARLGEAEARLAEVNAGLLRVDQARAHRDAAQARIDVAEARVEKARIELAYTLIKAPASGVVTRKFAETGQYVQPGQTLMLVVPLVNTWVVANFKETQLTRMKPGQPAEVTVDAYPDVVFRGVVDSIAAGTGARFSLLPPENATGNYVKIVQRIPVKVVLETPQDGPILRPGMNSVVRVRVSG